MTDAKQSFEDILAAVERDETLAGGTIEKAGGDAAPASDSSPLAAINQL